MIFDDFFKLTMAKLRGVLDKRRDDHLRSQMTPQKRILELRAEVNRGLRTRNFLDSMFWKEDLEPFLRGEAQLKPWAPGGPLQLEEVSTMHLWNSGKVYLLSIMITRFGKWVESGDAASKTLAEEDARNNLLTKK